MNLSSVSSSEGFLGQSIYGGTKAALEAMTRTWSRELAERCTVNAINPGPVKTDMWVETKQAFKEHVRDFQRHAPMAAIREGVDDEDLVCFFFLFFLFGGCGEWEKMCWSLGYKSRASVIELAGKFRSWKRMANIIYR